MSGISLTFPISDDRKVTLAADKPEQLRKMIDTLGGDGGEVADQIADALADPSRFVVVLGTVASEMEASGTSATSAADESSPSDPWQEPDGPAGEPEDDDPWADDSTPTQATKKPSPSSRKPSRTSESSSSGPNSSVKTDKFGRKFQFDLPDAPACDCEDGSRAAKMTANKKSGKGKYSKWVCAKSATEDWRDKCELSDWAN